MAGIELPGGIKIGADGVKFDPKKAAEAAVGAVKNTGTITIKVGEASPEAAKLEKAMKDNGIPVTENGAIALPEANALSKFVAAQEKSGGLKKGSVTIKDGVITITAEGQKALGIEAKASTPAQGAQTPAPAASSPDPVGAAKDAANKVGEAATGAAGWLKGKFKDLNKCNDASHAEYGSPACVDARQKQQEQRGQQP